MSIADRNSNAAKREIYLTYWQDLREQVRHFDSVRTQVNAIIMAAVGLTTAFAAEARVGPYSRYFHVDAPSSILMRIDAASSGRIMRALTAILVSSPTFFVLSW
jgi:hypothetical protein